MDEYEDDKSTPQWPQIDNDNLMITTIENFDDSVVKSINIIVTSANFTIEFKHISTYMVDTTKDERVGGYDGIWMNEGDSNTFEPMIDNNYFHVDVHEQGHHEMNGVLKNWTFNAKMVSCPKWKKQKEGMAIKFSLIQSCSTMILCFVMCVVAWMKRVRLKNCKK